MGKLKDKLYYLLVEKNPSIREEYQSYVRSHPDEHRFDRKRSLKLLLKLNWHYRILRKKNALPFGGGQRFLPTYGQFCNKATIS